MKGLYYGAHLTLGYEGKLENNVAYDIYGKFLWTHQNGDDTDVNGAKFKFKDTDSLKTRLGMKFTQENTEGFSPYVGLAWEHEFDGKAKATVNGLAIEEPKLKGDTGVVDIGFNYTPEENAGWSVGFKATGYFGQRRGGAGQILFKSEF